LELESFEASTAARKTLKASFFPPTKVIVNTEDDAKVDTPETKTEPEKILENVVLAEKKDGEPGSITVLAENDAKDGTTIEVIVQTGLDEVEKKVEGVEVKENGEKAAKSESKEGLEDRAEDGEKNAREGTKVKKEEEDGEKKKKKEKKKKGQKEEEKEKGKEKKKEGEKKEGEKKDDEKDEKKDDSDDSDDDSSDESSSSEDESKKLIDTSRLEIHNGVACNGCKATPIDGVRWKCLVCADYDLCDKCHDAGKSTDGHATTHNVMRLETRDRKHIFSFHN